MTLPDDATIEQWGLALVKSQLDIARMNLSKQAQQVAMDTILQAAYGQARREALEEGRAHYRQLAAIWTGYTLDKLWREWLDREIKEAGR